MTTALRRRLGLIPAEQATAPEPQVAALVTYTPVEHTYDDDRAARFHTAAITR